MDRKETILVTLHIWGCPVEVRIYNPHENNFFFFFLKVKFYNTYLTIQRISFGSYMWFLQIGFPLIQARSNCNKLAMTDYCHESPKFHGTSGSYRHFVKEFSRIVVPLTQLT